MFVKSKFYNTWSDMKRRAKKKKLEVYDKCLKNFAEFENWSLDNGY